MLQSELFTKTIKNSPKDETSFNAQALIRAGFVHKEMAGVYNILPLGLRVIKKIKTIIRDELGKVGAQEVNMSALQQKDIWERTERWNDDIVDDWFKTDLKSGTELGLAFTHEEPLASLMKNYVSSYRDLPKYIYQFQTKFRNELRAKSGIMRGREFIMKDLYDFSLDQKEHEAFYEKMKTVYTNIFKRVGIGEQTYLTMSSGGSFSKYSFEFQTISAAGEDTIVYDQDKKIAINKNDYSLELLKDFGLKEQDLNLKEAKSIEVGDIYSLGDKYSAALGLVYSDKDGKEKNVFMGSYGIGIQRLMGTIVEVSHDDKGIVWPEAVAPFRVHLLSLNQNEAAAKIYQDLLASNIDVLYDDRDVAAGEKFADYDLIGCPIRIVLSKKTLAEESVELKFRTGDETKLIKIGNLIKELI